MRSKISAGDPSIEGVNEEETEALKGLFSPAGRQQVVEAVPLEGKGIEVGGSVKFTERETPQLYSRFGIKDSDVIYHFHMRRYPDNFRELLADCFLAQIGTIRGVEASFINTKEFEERPHYWAVRAKGWADNPLALDRLGDDLVALVEERVA